MRLKTVIAVVGLCLAGLFSPAGAAQSDANEACVSCHDDEDLPDMSQSAHGFSAGSRAPECIACHGPSLTHVKKPPGVKEQPKPDITFGKTYGKVTPVAAAQRSRACQSCHDRESKRSLWVGSAHQAADVSCDTCHKVHANKDAKLASKLAQTEFCLTCHKPQRSQISRASHHPMPEGKMTCSDCHNVHGSAGPKLAKRDSTNATCYTCHAEKRGPFVHQHEPVADDCSNCHNPHGSTVAGMLTARAPMLCQQCHTPHVAGEVATVAGRGAPLVSGMSGGKNTVNMWQGRSCMNCHTQIHGSNNPSVSNPTPQLWLR